MFLSWLLMLQSCVGLRLLHLPAQISQSGNTYKLSGKWTKGSMDPNSFIPSKCAKEVNFAKEADSVQPRALNESVHFSPAYDLMTCCHGATDDAVFPLDFHFLELLKKWSNKRIGFFGDSITQQIITSIAYGAKHHGIDFQRVNSQWYYVPAYNITIQRRCQEMKLGKQCWEKEMNENRRAIQRNWCREEETRPSCGVVSPLPGLGILNNSRYATPPELLDFSLEHADIFYINVGLHIWKESEEVQNAEFQYIRETMEKHLKENPGKQFFFRLTLPQHFIGEHGTGSPYELRSNTDISKCVGYGTPAVEHASTILTRKVFSGSHVKVLDLFDFVSTRGDLHGQECTHYCWNYEMWKGIWFLMANSLN